MTKTRVINSIYPLTIKIINISIQQQLQQFLVTQLLKLNTSDFTNFLNNNHSISIYRLPKIDSITYRCAIAFQLSPHLSLSPVTVAQSIVRTIEQPLKEAGGLLNKQKDLCLTFTLKLLERGWLDFTLCDRSLFIWLRCWQQFSYPGKRFTPKSGNHNNLWCLEYTYARCCSLLRLGEQEGLIKLKKNPFQFYQWSLSTLQEISWSSLVLNEFERSLIAQIILTVDRLVNDSNSNEIKLAVALSESFLKFERYCRIFGETSRQNLQLSQARLGLVAITQILLQGLWLSQIDQPLRNRL
ncbi:MAG: arginyl-tRNA synthetase [Crocosphaera sp.]|nr:arginyl-tRNA synthetase [Crocosphaera sp.]